MMEFSSPDKTVSGRRLESPNRTPDTDLSFFGEMLQRTRRQLIHMAVFRMCLFCSLFIVVLSNLISAQANEVHDVFVCKEVEKKISDAIKITKVARRVAYADECEFYFYSDPEWFSVHVEKYKTEEMSKKEFSDEFDFLTLAETYPESVKQLNRRNFWEEAKGYHKRSDSDHLIMLRYKQVNITLISSSYKLIFGIEPLLRTVQFREFDH